MRLFYPPADGWISVLVISGAEFGWRGAMLLGIASKMRSEKLGLRLCLPEFSCCGAGTKFSKYASIHKSS